MSLTSYLSSIADAIRTKKGTSDPINAQDFANEILNISGGDVVVLDVGILPTDNINENVLYRTNTLSAKAWLYYQGSKCTSLPDFDFNTVKVIVVDTLPEVGEPFNNIDENGNVTLTAYYQVSDNIAYGYNNGGWPTLAFLLLNKLGVIEGTKDYYGGVITSEDQATDNELIYTLYEAETTATSNLYYYRDGWRGVGACIAKNAGVVGDITAEMYASGNYSDATLYSGIYFNTSLSVEEVVATIDTIVEGGDDQPIAVLGNVITDSEVLPLLVGIGKESGVYLIMAYLGNNLIFVFTSADLSVLGIEFVGWNPEIVSKGGAFEYDMYLVAPGETIEGYTVDTQQDKYANIMSLSPNFNDRRSVFPISGEFDTESLTITENGTYDTKSMFLEQKLPWTVKVDVPKPSGTKTIIENGTHDVIDCESVTVDVPSTLYDYENDNVTYIAANTFRGADFIRSLNCPTLQTIGNYAFYNCSNLATIVLPDSVISIGTDVFLNTAYYNNEANWENDVLYIGNHLIRAKKTLTGAYTIKEGVLTIAKSAFASCSNLSYVEIPDSVTSIGDDVFTWCSSMTVISIPDSVTSIGSHAFNKCTSLMNINYSGTKAQWKAINLVAMWDTNTSDYIITCTDGTIAKDGTET